MTLISLMTHHGQMTEIFVCADGGHEEEDPAGGGGEEGSLRGLREGEDGEPGEDQVSGVPAQ